MKKIICIFLTVVMFAAAFTVTALAAEPEFEYKISVTDAQGKTVTDFGSLEKGDTVSVGVSLNRTDISDSYTAYGVEMTLTAKGLEYGSGEVFSGGSLSNAVQSVSNTETVRFSYYDFSREGMEFSNSFQVGKCTFTVTDPESAGLWLSTGLVYLTGGSAEGYIPGENHECSHSKTETKYISCDDGTHIVRETCSACGVVIGEKTENCTMKATVIKEADCTADGEKTHVCEKCGYKYSEVIKAYGHTPENDAGVEATCTEAGKTQGSHCSTCGEIIKKQETIPAKGHSWDKGTVTKEATADKEGEIVYKCESCGAVRTEKIPAKAPGGSGGASGTPGGGNTENPATGDESMILVCAVLSVFALMGGVCIILIRKKEC